MENYLRCLSEIESVWQIYLGGCGNSYYGYPLAKTLRQIESVTFDSE